MTILLCEFLESLLFTLVVESEANSRDLDGDEQIEVERAVFQ